MTVALEPQDVFTPNSFPEHSYVQRLFYDSHAQNYFNPEEKLREALKTVGLFVSIVGPSKSGKTISVKSVVGPERLIEIPGSELAADGDFWAVSLKKLGISLEERRGSRQTDRTGREVEFSINPGVPGVISASAKDKDVVQRETGVDVVSTLFSSSLDRLVEGGRGFVFLLDDFHYLPVDMQVKVARQVKSAAEKGLRICVAEVPHGGHSLIRSNPDLAGRYDRIDFSYWQTEDLERIAKEGFNELKYGVTGSAITAFAAEAAGSPQLMQRICLAASRYLLRRASPGFPGTSEVLTREELSDILISASSRDREKVIEALIKGPPTRGQDRNSYSVRDGTKADVYEVILFAVSSDPPVMSFDKKDLMARIALVLDQKDLPPPGSITSTLKQMHKLVSDMDPGVRLIDLDDGDVLHVVDPYFFFELRWYPRHRKVRAALGAGGKRGC